MIDTSTVREDTPYCLNILFFNSAGSSLPPKQVTQSIIEYLEEEEKIGGYRLADIQQKRIQDFYQEAAQLLNCQADQVAFTFNATDSYARALSSIPFNSQDLILTTEDDYLSNQIAFLSLKKRMHIRVERGIKRSDTTLDVEHFCNLIIDKRPKLVCVTHVPTNSGTIQDIQKIGQVCADLGILYLVDACQSVGQLPIDVKKIKCDFLSTTGRKFLRGPRGTGLLYISDRVLNDELVPLFIDMRGADWNSRDNFKLFPGARRFEMWEFPYALLVGLTEAISYANKVGLSNISQYNRALCKHLRSGLQNIHGVKQFDYGQNLASIITIQKEGVSQQQMQSYLDQNNVYYSLSNKTGALLDYQSKGIDWTIRISPHYFNTMEEIDSLLDILEVL